MAKAKTIFVCTDCGASQGSWAGQCRQCKSWNTLEEEAAPAAGSGAGRAKAIAKGGAAALSAPAPVRRLSEHSPADYPRFSSGSGEVDRVLGGGIVPGSAIVLSAPPGGGKSTLSSALADHLAGQGKKVLYVAGEESGEQIRLRTDRLGLANSHLIDLAAETEVGAICARIASGYDFAVVDSVQTLSDADLTGAAGSVSIVKQVGQALVRTAKESGAAILLIGHVNKDGNLAGPRHLEHMVDAVLELTGERTQGFRLLRAQKNRFGSTSEVGLFELTGSGLVEVQDATAVFLQEHEGSVPGAVVCPTIEGSRPIMVEVQALTSPVSGAAPNAMRRCLGIDKNRLDMMIAVLQRHAGMSLKLGSQDIFVEVSGGMRIEERALDLAVCAAIASAASGRPIRQNTAVFGEVSLLGDVRPAGQADRRTAEASKLGWTRVVAGRRQGNVHARSLKTALREILSSEPGGPADGE